MRRSQPMPATKLLPIGTAIKYGSGNWRVAAIAWLGERYYFLVRGPREVAMIPADIVERDNQELLLEVTVRR